MRLLPWATRFSTLVCCSFFRAWLVIARESSVRKPSTAIIRADGGVIVSTPDEDVPLHRVGFHTRSSKAELIHLHNEVDFKQSTSHGKVGIVVASYCNDDLTWLSVLSCNDVNVYLYNKCEHVGVLTQTFPSDGQQPLWRDIKDGYPNKTAQCVRLTTLANQGRDSHSHLTHIHANYEALDPFTVFLQGPLEFKGHVMPFLKWLISDAGKSMIEWQDAPAQVGAKSLGFVPLGSTCCASYPYQQDAPWGRIHCGLIKLVSGSNTCDDYLTSLRGQFGISRVRLQRNTRSLYESLANIVVMKGAIDEEGFMPERSWALLAGCVGKNAKGNPADIPVCLDGCNDDAERCGPNHPPRKVDTHGMGLPNAELFQQYLNSTGVLMQLTCTALDNDPSSCDLKQEFVIAKQWTRLRQLVGASIPDVPTA